MAEQDRFVLLDGFKRLRALKRLKRDTILATLWDMNEADGLLLERMMRSSQAEGPLEQGWLLRELRDRFQMSMDVLARHFDRTTSWVSRRLALVQELPEPVQDQVRAGRIAPHTAMKVLVPFRGNLLSNFQIFGKEFVVDSLAHPTNVCPCLWRNSKCDRWKIFSTGIRMLIPRVLMRMRMARHGVVQNALA